MVLESIFDAIKNLMRMGKSKKQRKKSPRKIAKKRSGRKKASLQKKKIPKKSPKKTSKKESTVKKKIAIKKKPIIKKKNIAAKNLKSVAKKKTASKKKVPLKVKNKPIVVKKLANSKKVTQEEKGVLVGEITHFFSRISVIVVKIVNGKLSVGDEIMIKGKGTNFAQKVDSLQIESNDVKVAKKGQLVGLQVKKIAKVGDRIFKL
ncbi:MAG: hypothetical protein KKD07_06955 [Candidatus Omnitrophica bacterium]|nr:hypothetical protein [Candidatus Omnitrophota bacterium]MBU1997577.1 hypothetical protein [Candidatus Omnitrophota bacterium]MBU4334163.1 hypothetical protein [Candidatus Omnitrophota bacterium]